MKRVLSIFCGALCFLLIIVLIGCLFSNNQLQNRMDDYAKMVDGDVPDDLTLTIYYIDPQILTRAPLRIEDLKTHTDVTVITIESAKLAEYQELLRKMTASILRPVKEKAYINARLYYVFESKGRKMLEVAMTSIYSNAFVNGIEVESNPIFYEIILPFLSETDREILGVSTE